MIVRGLMRHRRRTANQARREERRGARQAKKGHRKAPEPPPNASDS